MTHKRRMSALDQVVLPETRRLPKSARSLTPITVELCPIRRPKVRHRSYLLAGRVARINEFGFVRAIPHVKGSKVSSEITYLSADDERIRLSLRLISPR